MIAAAQGADRETIRTWLELQYGTDKGTAWISVGPGREAVKPFSDTPFAWPEQVEEIVDFIAKENEKGYNVWYAAHLSYSKRSKSDGGEGRKECRSVKRRRLHFDIDRALTAEDTRKLAQLDAWLVYSGSPGHVHAYIELAESIDVALYHKLEDALKGHFDSDQSVCRDNGILRIPGTINQMSPKKRHPTAPVLWDGKVSQTKWTPEQIRSIVGIETVERVAAKQATTVEVSTDPIVPREPGQMPAPVRELLNAPTPIDRKTGLPDRSAYMARIINACKANHLTIEGTLYCLLQNPDQAQRAKEKGPAFTHKEVRKLYGTADQYNPQLADKAADDILGISGKATGEGQADIAQPRVNPIRARALSLRGLSTLTPAEFLVEGFLYQNTLVQLSAEPGSFKTFFALAMSCALASKKTEWLGHRVKSCPVLYVAAEGANGMLARVEAWCQTESTGDTKVTVDDLNLTFYPEAVQLDDPQQMKDLEEFVAEEGFGLVVIDTRARCTTGLEENSATEQGKAIAAAEKLRSHTGATIMMVHHSARAGAGAASAGRGSNAWDGAVWSDLRSKSRDLTLEITCAKHKDVESGCTHGFSMLPIVLPTGQTTLVVGRAGEFVPEQERFDPVAMAQLTQMLDAQAERTGMTLKEIAEALGVAKETARVRVKKARELNLVIEVNEGQRYPHYATSRDSTESP